MYFSPLVACAFLRFRGGEGGKLHVYRVTVLAANLITGSDTGNWGGERRSARSSSQRGIVSRRYRSHLLFE